MVIGDYDERGSGLCGWSGSKKQFYPVMSGFLEPGIVMPVDFEKDINPKRSEFHLRRIGMSVSNVSFFDVNQCETSPARPRVCMDQDINIAKEMFSETVQRASPRRNAHGPEATGHQRRRFVDRDPRRYT